MGSLRNPVGPLPSSIYWRRRVVLVSMAALLALLVIWIVTSGGGGGGHKDAGGAANGKNPTPSAIEPGPSQSGPAISQHPGGRDESGGGGSGGSGASSGGSGGTGGAGSGGSGAAASTGGAGDDGKGGSTGGGGTGAALPAGSTLPDCTASAVRLSLRSVRNSYGPTETPAFELIAKNASGSDCKVDLGPRTAVLTVSQAGGDGGYWSSADCPKTAGSLLYRVPAGSGITSTVRWDRRPSAPQCATPPSGTAALGKTYLVEAKVPGYGKLQTSFVLSAD
ncbi:hypothetical protein ACFPC0_19840 [Streptomyces andamanensis]|uniref:DUF4232 domain-containing protein n=1 Tax=Streptomyces andamanensis TaxID=1565035 RepID=A0ABV8TH96_9ACTN